MSARASIIAAALVLASCASVPSALRLPTPEENRAIGAARAAWEAAGRPHTECDALERARVAVLDHDELQRECSAVVEVEACASAVNLTLFDPPSYMLLVSARLDEDGRTSAIVHEALHALRSCAVDDAAGSAEYLRRYKRGETDACRITYAGDHRHCDRELWDTIHADALRRWAGEERSR